jgi:BirA family biotin operon repressor/biotin-[acetyl-CoA-carboxylase] ligase
MGEADATSAGGGLPRAAAAARLHGPGPVRHVAVTGSTNTDLAAEARRGSTEGAVLLADHQTAGRGRLDRRWEDASGSALLVSLRVPLADGGGGTEAPALVRAAGAAARAAAAALVRVPVLAKWPNDLVVLDGPAPGKLAGVLAEYVAGPAGGSGAVVIGIGCNLLPAEVEGATSVAECGGEPDRDRLLALLLEEFSARRADPTRVIGELRDHSSVLGTRVRVTLPGGDGVEGLAVGIDDRGRLELVGDDGRRTVDVGDVVRLRSG